MKEGIKEENEPPGGRQQIRDSVLALEKILNDGETQSKAKAKAQREWDSIRRWNNAGEFAAIIGALAAGAASTAYFSIMWENPVWEEGDFLLPSAIFMAVSAASWYMYRLDVVESFILSFSSIKLEKEREEDNSCGNKYPICLALLALAVLFTVSMDMSLTGFGVFEFFEGDQNAQIGFVLAVCAASLFAEGAQQFKYIKDVFDWNKLKAMVKPPESASGTFYMYSFASLFAMTFYGMTVFRLLEEMGDPAAIALVGIYVLFSMPYYCNKAADQVRADKNSTTITFSGFNAARAGNMLGDICFSLYGFFETMRATGQLEKPHDLIQNIEDPKTQGLLFLGLLVVVATCVSSFTLTAECNKDGYFKRLNKLK